MKKKALTLIQISIFIVMHLILLNCTENNKGFNENQGLIPNAKIINYKTKNISDTVIVTLTTDVDSLSWNIEEIPSWLIINKTKGIVFLNSSDTIEIVLSNTLNPKKSQNVLLEISSKNYPSQKIFVDYTSKGGKIGSIIFGVFLSLVMLLIIISGIIRLIEWLYWYGQTIVIILLSIFFLGLAGFLVFIPLDLLHEFQFVQKWLEINTTMRIVSTLTILIALVLYIFNRAKSKTADTRANYSYGRYNSYGQYDPGYVEKLSDSEAEQHETYSEVFLVTFIISIILTILGILAKTWLIYILIPIGLFVIIFSIYQLAESD